MTVNNLVEDVLKSIINAQYSAYVHSQTLGEQDSESLFPIPIAEIKEITLDLQFAYAKSTPKTSEPEEHEALPHNVYHSLEGIYTNAFTKAKKALVDGIDMSTASANQSWIPMKANLLRGKMDAYVMSEFKRRFLDGAKSLISPLAIHLQAVKDLLIKVIQDTILNHPDLKPITEQVNPMPAVREAVEDNLAPQANYIQQRFQDAKTKKVKEGDSSEIIVDSAELKELPTQSLQHAKLVLDIKKDVNKVS